MENLTFQEFANEFKKNKDVINDFNDEMVSIWLKGRGFIDMDGNSHKPYIDDGYFTQETLLTPKGTVWLTKMLKAEYDLD